MIHLSPAALVLQDYVERMDDARDEAEQGKQYVQPEMSLQPDLEKYTEGWQKYGENNLDRVCDGNGHDGSLVGWIESVGLSRLDIEHDRASDGREPDLRGVPPNVDWKEFRVLHAGLVRSDLVSGRFP